MARIRTVKPDLWTDEKVVKLPFEARLLFIGSFNFADDEGYLVDEPERLGLQVLPADRGIDMDALVDLLVAAGLLDRLVAEDGSTLLRVTNFDRHQKVSHPAESRLKDESVYRKKGVSNAGRRAVAAKYGCPPGEELPASCFYCDSPGVIHWWPNYSNGKPSAWVSFSGLEVDHFEPERAGGTDDAGNLVLACRPCNRAKKDRSPYEYLEDSRILRPELNRTEWNRKPIAALEGSGGLAKVSEDSELYDVVLTVCNIDPDEVSRTARKPYDVAVTDLRRLGATGDDVMDKAMAFRRQWPNASLTPTALVRRWAELSGSNHNDLVLARFAAGGES